MPVIGAAYVTLNVAGYGTDSEILIAPELEGLILGINRLQTRVVSGGISTKEESNSARETGLNSAERLTSLKLIPMDHIS